MFNPEPKVEVVPIVGDQVCYVIDDALLDPDRWVEFAVARQGDFSMAPFNAYPGFECHLPEALSARLDDYFRLHLRRRFELRRTLKMYSRLSLVTLQPQQLSPIQWLCHRDRFGVPANERAVAAVLYLFRDDALGGTSFFTPTHSAAETDALMRDASTACAETFGAATGVRRGYLTESNAWFERVCTVQARWNRLIFYDGSLFHSPDIQAPGLLSADPCTGRLTLNGFFTCSRQNA